LTKGKADIRVLVNGSTWIQFVGLSMFAV